MTTNYYDLINLQASPCIRFNKEGILLAVSANDNGVKILANSDGIRLLRTIENRTFDASRVASAAVVKVDISFDRSSTTFQSMMDIFKLMILVTFKDLILSL